MADVQDTVADVPEAKPEAKPKSFLKSFLSGGFGGMCLVVAGQPMDLIKVRLQTQPEPPIYTSAMDCARKIIAKDGLKGLYQGMSAPLMGVTPIFAVCFWAYDLGQKLERSFLGLEPTAPLSVMQLGVAGAFSAVPTTAVMAPGERIKVLLQTDGVDGAPKKYNGPVDLVKKLVAEEGISSVFRGAAATLARDSIGSFAYFAGYEGIKKALSDDPTTLSPLAVVSGGGIAGMLNWAVAIPFDTVKSRIQSAPQGTYTGMVDCYRKLVADKGHSALFRGIGPAMSRAFPANAACFLGVELSLKFMNMMW
jgi:solute carrier family 25 carnitine/acylcarnitine transporter 20/29